MNENGDLRIKIWDRYYKNISDKDQWGQEINKKCLEYKNFIDNFWLAKFMDSIKNKRDKEAEFSAKIINRLIEAGVFWGEKNQPSHLYTISTTPNECISFFADKQWAMFSPQAQKEFVAALNENNHLFFKISPINEKNFVQKLFYNAFVELENLIKFDKAMFLLKKRGVRIEIDDKSVENAKKGWAFFYVQEGEADVWQGANDKKELEDFKMYEQMSEKEVLVRVEAAKSYKFQYFKFSESKDSLATALSLLKVKLLSLAKQLKTR